MVSISQFDHNLGPIITTGPQTTGPEPRAGCSFAIPAAVRYAVSCKTLPGLVILALVLAVMSWSVMGFSYWYVATLGFLMFLAPVFLKRFKCNLKRVIELYKYVRFLVIYNNQFLICRNFRNCKSLPWTFSLSNDVFDHVGVFLFLPIPIIAGLKLSANSVCSAFCHGGPLRWTVVLRIGDLVHQFIKRLVTLVEGETILQSVHFNSWCNQLW